MNFEAFVTCAVTGSGATTDKSPHVPVTPEQIADSAIEAARAGAAIAHIHVRDPETGKGSRDTALYREVVDRVRASDVDVVINLTAGMGGDMVFGPGERPLPLDPAGTDMVGPLERLKHVEELLPEICTLDCGTMNFAESDYVMTNTPGALRTMAMRVKELGVRPELEVFDSTHRIEAMKRWYKKVIWPDSEETRRITRNCSCGQIDHEKRRSRSHVANLEMGISLNRG